MDIHEVTKDNVTTEDLFLVISKLSLRMLRLEAVCVDLISVVMGADEMDMEDAEYVTKAAARFVVEIAEERKAEEELRLAAIFLNSPE